MIAQYNLCSCRVSVCLSVCLSDGLSQVGVLLKQLNIGSCKSRGECPFCGGNAALNGVPNLFYRHGNAVSTLSQPHALHERRWIRHCVTKN